jgi:hypothetical protein
MLTFWESGKPPILFCSFVGGGGWFGILLRIVSREIHSISRQFFHWITGDFLNTFLKYSSEFPPNLISKSTSSSSHNIQNSHKVAKLQY